MRRQLDGSVAPDDCELLAVAALGADPPVADGDRARKPGRDLGVVGNRDDRGVQLAVDVLDRVENLVAIAVVELAGGLVGQQQARQCRDAHRDGQPLQLPRV